MERSKYVYIEAITCIFLLSLPSLQEEVDSVINFLTRRDPISFRRAGDDSFEIGDPREAWILGANVTDSFFLQKGEDGTARAFPINLSMEFSTIWARDIAELYPELCTGKKIVKFFPSPITTAGYSGKSAEYRTRRAEEKRLGELYASLKESKMEPSDCLFVPYSYYNSGPHLSELIFHYVAGLIFKDMGYLVCNEFAPSVVSDSGKRPDVSAFTTESIDHILRLLRNKGIISGGAFWQELQLFSVFEEKQKFKAQRPGSLLDRPPTEAGSVLIEVKRNERYLLKKGKEQVQDYLLAAYGFYDEGYLFSPMLEESQEAGMISIKKDGERIFSRAEQTQAQFLPEWNKRKKDQLDNLGQEMIIQLAKNLPIAKIDSALGGAQSYEDLVERVRASDPERILG